MTNTIGQREKLEAAVERLREALDESGRDAAIGLHGEVYLAPEDATDILAALSSPPAGEVDMRKVVEALGFEPDNHHNAAMCPYCTPSPGVEKTGEQEAIARIIAPGLRWSLQAVVEEVTAMRKRSGKTDWETTIERAAAYRYDLHEGARGEALAKAALILALSPTSGGGAGEHEREARQDRLMDSAYASGLLAGWNYCVSDDREGLNAARESRWVGHRAAIAEARERDQAAAISAAPSSPEDIGGLG